MYLIGHVFDDSILSTHSESSRSLNLSNLAKTWEFAFVWSGVKSKIDDMSFAAEPDDA